MAESLTISDYASYVASLFFIICLIMGVAVVARRMGYGNGRITSKLALSLTKGKIFNHGLDKRLLINEVMALDQKRRVVLIQKDNREFCLLLGINNDLLLDSRDITASDDMNTHDINDKFAKMVQE